MQVAVGIGPGGANQYVFSHSTQSLLIVQFKVSALNLNWLNADALAIIPQSLMGDKYYYTGKSIYAEGTQSVSHTPFSDR